MSKVNEGYKLADGSLSTDYEVGDEFIVVGERSGSAIAGQTVKFIRDDGSHNPWFVDGGVCCSWSSLKPIEKTKQKSMFRKMDRATKGMLSQIFPNSGFLSRCVFIDLTPKFTISKGDYIDSRKFTREELERFCELAVECGFSPEHFEINSGWDLHFIDNEGDLVSGEGGDFDAKNNITSKFREFLNKEKGMNKPAKFTKDDLKDGMRLTDREGDVFYVTGKSIHTDRATNKYEYANLDEFNDNLCIKHTGFKNCDIIKVTDRDGTVLFEREEEPRELTIEEIAEAFNLPVDRIRIKK